MEALEAYPSIASRWLVYTSLALGVVLDPTCTRRVYEISWLQMASLDFPCGLYEPRYVRHSFLLEHFSDQTIAHRLDHSKREFLVGTEEYLPSSLWLFGNGSLCLNFLVETGRIFRIGFLQRSPDLPRFWGLIIKSRKARSTTTKSSRGDIYHEYLSFFFFRDFPQGSCKGPFDQPSFTFLLRLLTSYFIRGAACFGRGFERRWLLLRTGSQVVVGKGGRFEGSTFGRIFRCPLVTGRSLEP